jgi:DivIVA domain-containing protein
VREPRRVPAELRNVSFPVSVRGYDRRAVDIHIARVNRLIAELEATRSPEAAVRHALEQAEEQTSSILHRARETAEQMIATARQEADEITARAKAEAADIVVNASTEADRAKAGATTQVAKATTEAEEILARSREEADEALKRSREEVAAVRERAEAWAREFLTDTEAVWEERRALLDDVRQIAARLATAATRAGARLPPGKPAEEGARAFESEAESEHGGDTLAEVHPEGVPAGKGGVRNPGTRKRQGTPGAESSAS